MTAAKKRKVSKRVATKSRSGTTPSQDARRASGASVVASFRMPRAVVLLIDLLAAKLNVSKSEVVRLGIDALWRVLPDDDESAAKGD